MEQVAREWLVTFFMRLELWALNEIIKQQVIDKWKKKALAHIVPNCTAGHTILFFYNILICLDAQSINKFWKLLDGLLKEKSVKDS